MEFLAPTGTLGEKLVQGGLQERELKRDLKRELKESLKESLKRAYKRA